MSVRDVFVRRCSRRAVVWLALGVAFSATSATLLVVFGVHPPSAGVYERAVVILGAPIMMWFALYLVNHALIAVGAVPFARVRAGGGRVVVGSCLGWWGLPGRKVAFDDTPDARFASQRTVGPWSGLAVHSVILSGGGRQLELRTYGPVPDLSDALKGEEDSSPGRP